ncbi:unnamed protein product [Protopolystoma xenopodis]|uniref:Uncharacterized protein n=1 Tax=Protopolystoma xenopodis TaxID=117903 RepID=A0A3S5CCC1_9PLAT|nr:unnamed protein product [Protopolystoma xenopodis]
MPFHEVAEIRVCLLLISLLWEPLSRVQLEAQRMNDFSSAATQFQELPYHEALSFLAAIAAIATIAHNPTNPV